MIVKVGDKVKINRNYMEHLRRTTRNDEMYYEYLDKVLIIKDVKHFESYYGDIHRLYFKEGDVDVKVYDNLKPVGHMAFSGVNTDLFHSPLFDIVHEYNIQFDKADICKKCSSVGTIIRTACICKNCGNVIWGF